MKGQGTACRTPRLDDRDVENSRGQIGRCPSCDAPVISERIGGSVRRFCSNECRWEWHRGERRQERIDSIGAAACPLCRGAVLRVVESWGGAL